MITSLLSTQSRKAWVAGVLSALLTPILTLLSGTNVITIRALVIALITGLLTAAAVWATENTDPRPSVSGDGSGAATPTAPVAAPAAVVSPAPIVPAVPGVQPQPTTLDTPSPGFPGQNVSG